VVCFFFFFLCLFCLFLGGVVFFFFFFLRFAVWLMLFTILSPSRDPLSLTRSSILHTIQWPLYRIGLLHAPDMSPFSSGFVFFSHSIFYNFREASPPFPPPPFPSLVALFLLGPAGNLPHPLHALNKSHNFFLFPHSPPV